jgi:hypothetical protein
MLDRQNLEEEFNMQDNQHDETIELEPEVSESGPDKFEEEWEKENNPRNIIRDNIERANKILDTVEEELNNGNITARLVEVATGLINSVTQASKELITDENYQVYLQIRNRMLLLKDKEIEMKRKKKEAPKNQNLIIASREDVLKLLKEPKE